MEETAEQIESAISALEAQRAILGDAVVAMAVAPLKDKLAARHKREGAVQQLKTATVLFMDVVGSTQLSQRLDPEDVHAVMDSALERLTAIVRAHQGRVLQYAGDSLLAAFGADQALEDDAERAVRAGLAILAEAAPLAAGFGARYGLDGFDLRVGIHTGPVLLGGGIDADGSIRGITVNIAARMEQTAPAGSLRISHETYRHVRGVFDVEPQAPIEIKGITGPVRSYLVARAKPRAFRMANRGLEGIETQMVGRDAELVRVGEAFQGACEDKSLRQVTIVGEPGIGKSRLGLEFTHWLEMQREPVRFFQGRPQPYGNNVPYGLLRDLLAWRFEILESDPQSVARDKLATGLGAVLGDRAAEYTALIGALIGFDYGSDTHIAAIASEARQIRDRAFHGLASYFRALHRDAGTPIVLLLDDLHWADEGSLDFVNHLVKSCGDLPIFLLCLTRSTLYERRPLWGSGRSDHLRIDLAPLSKRGTRELIEALLSKLDTVPTALRDLLASSAEGNPYFVEELIGMLIDDGVIVTDSAPWHVSADKLLDVRVPSTLAGVLQARIDGLPPAEKSALQQASVIGHVFWDEALQRIAPAAGDALDGLMRRELAYGRETSAFEGTREFVFKHHVLHQVAYQGVLKQSRREQHRLTADWLVVRSGDRASEYFGLIAEHYERAGDIANALDYLRKAGEDAARSYANAAALEYLGRALALVRADDAASRFALLETRRGIHANTGRRAEQAEDVAALEQAAEQLDDDAFRARAAGNRAALALVTGDYPGATAAAARAVALAEAAGERAAALSARINWARALQFQGDYAGAQAHIEGSLVLAREVGDRRVESTTLGQLGILATQRGQYGIARGYYRQALDVARAIGHRSLESGMINNLGETEQQLGNYDAALELFQAGRRLCAEIGQRVADAYLLCNMALSAFRRGGARESIEWATQAMQLAEDLKDRDLQAILRCVRAHAHTALGQWDDAVASYRDSAALFREIGRTTMPPEPIAGLARVALARGDVDAATTAIAEVLAHFDGGGSVDGTEDPLWIYLTCHDVLAASRSPRAAEFLQRAQALLDERAGPLGEAERESFLANVPSHRAVVAAWQAAGRDTPA
ncbi:MAG TPA: adenylate/guanylate cyclase domain-containing protein [Caldimonas sp.]|jgi:class 3 adenylate cyclase/tetratricopeptide (TPR) repeat protein|nr:adenylate/guanylate cyclase domain-containing protein [Caldimonas sp.]HEV7575851.1 adenylate/guanylate cyclase domain-containing protein [Caldimonas sp.]